MQREIKFRSWDNVWKIMCAGVTIDDIEKGFKGLRGNIDKEVIVMQYTGLKDKHGVEIYEGDIVIRNDGGGETELNPKEGWIRIAEVKFDPIYNLELTTKTPSGIPGHKFGYHNFIYKDTHNHLKVIGNIYENKDLL